MLQRIRDGVTGWVAGLLLFVIAIAFVFWGIDFGFLGRSQVASVNGEEIPLPQIREAVQNQLNRYQQFYQNGVPPELEQGIRRNVVEQLVRNEVLAQYTAETGYRIGDEQLGKAIREMEPFQQNGRFSPELYKTRLAMQGRSARSFQEQMRRGLEITQMQEALTESAFVTPSEVSRQTRLRNEQREIAYAVFPAAEYAASIEPDDAGVQVYYENNQASYMTPDTVSLEYLVLDASDMADDVEVSQADLESFYEQEVAAGRFSQPAERKAVHILIAVDDDTSDSDAATLAAELSDRVRAGEDFAALASEYSDDAASADVGGDLGWLEEEALTGALRDAVFGMEAGELRGPVKSEFGYHVIRLEAVRGGVAKPLADVAEELRAELQRRQVEDRFYDRRDELVDLAFESDGLIAPAQTLGLTVQRVDQVTRNGGAGIAANPEILQAAFSPRVLEERANSDVIMLEDTRAVVIRVVERQPPAQLDLEQVRPQIVAELKRQASREAAREAGQATLAAVRAGSDLNTASTEHAARYESARTIGRTASGLPAGLRDAVFKAARPADGAVTYGGVDLPNGDFAVYALLQVKPGEAQPEDAAAITQAAARLGISEFAAVTTALTEDADVQIRLDQLE